MSGREVALDVQLAVSGASSASASAGSVLDVLAALGGSTEHLVDLLADSANADVAGLFGELRTQPSSLLRTELIGGTASGALELLFKPSDRYLDLVSAIARRLDVACDLDAHGWPILSMVADEAIVRSSDDAASARAERQCV